MVNGRIAIVTGAASGIGLAIAESLAAAGAKVVMADINEEKLKVEAQRIGGDYKAVNLTKADENKALVDYTIEKYGKVEILVNVAGVQVVSPIEDFPEDKWQFIIDLMLTAPFLLTKYCWKSMQENKWGRVINLNSIHGIVASEYKIAYVSAKHGLSGLTKVAALEGGAHGITVNSICPAYVRTPLVDNQIADQAKTHGISENEVIETIMLKNSAIKKLVPAKSVGELALFLCSEAADVITGVTLPIDGGWTAR